MNHRPLPPLALLLKLEVASVGLIKMTCGIYRSALISGFRECTGPWARLAATSASKRAQPIFFLISDLD